MTLTLIIGSSGSGKTTYLNDVYMSHKCTYIRQYHAMRPYIPVSKIPNFDPAKLPFWGVYEKEGKAATIKVGGTMAGEFTAGLSGGQRKMLLFELIHQRTKGQSNLLIALDEPFSGVTSDFVPYIVRTLNAIREKHNILLVTNDHIEELRSLADNTITVSVIDRSIVHVNDTKAFDRQKVVLALSVGDDYAFTSKWDDLKFFCSVEVLSNRSLLGVAIFAILCFALFIASFWNSLDSSSALVVVAGGIVAYYCVNPYLLSLVDWRNAMLEEAEALMHASKGMNKILKTMLTLFIILVISVMEFGAVNAVINGLSTIDFWVAMLFDSASMTFPLLCLGLYTKMPFQAVEMIGALPFLLMIFFSTTFSPGSGIPILKELRYLFSRFYFWCMLPSVQDSMEGCPAEEDTLLYLVLSGLLGTVIFLGVMGVMQIWRRFHKVQNDHSKRVLLADEEYRTLQTLLYKGKKHGVDDDRLLKSSDSDRECYNSSTDEESCSKATTMTSADNSSCSRRVDVYRYEESTLPAFETILGPLDDIEKS